MSVAIRLGSLYGCFSRGDDRGLGKVLVCGCGKLEILGPQLRVSCGGLFVKSSELLARCLVACGILCLVNGISFGFGCSRSCICCLISCAEVLRLGIGGIAKGVVIALEGVESINSRCVILLRRFESCVKLCIVGILGIVELSLGGVEDLGLFEQDLFRRKCGSLGCFCGSLVCLGVGGSSSVLLDIALYRIELVEETAVGASGGGIKHGARSLVAASYGVERVLGVVGSVDTSGERHLAKLFLKLLFSCFLFCLGSILKSLEVGCDLIGIGYTLTDKEVVSGNSDELQVAGQLIELLVVLDDIALEDIITDGIILAELSVFLQLLVILIADGEAESGAVFDRLEEAVSDVAFHVDRRTRHLNISVQHDADEGDRVAGSVVTAGIQRNVHDVVNVLPRECVGAVGHDLAEVIGKVLEEIDGEALGVVAVVRLILVEVGVEVGAESGNRDTALVSLGIVLEQVFGKLAVEVVEVRGRDSKLKASHKGLLCSAVISL